MPDRRENNGAFKFIAAYIRCERLPNFENYTTSGSFPVSTFKAMAKETCCRKHMLRTHVFPCLPVLPDGKMFFLETILPVWQNWETLKPWQDEEKCCQKHLQAANTCLSNVSQFLSHGKTFLP